MGVRRDPGDIPRPDTRWNGDNHGGWSTAEYDSVVEAFNRTLDPSERIQQRIRIAKLLTEELPVIALYYQLAPVAHVAAVRGPVPVSLGTSGYASWNIHEWELV